ncbi:amidase [Actinomadura sp. NBRC 104425]|uniref:amidase n=1 Tax=Actinomadura sp. NBRC 104425 TaxID=3032204 RepID=UPI0024A524B5|nr:amidase [Actinomadura sp. NBRC 104425]GLZ11719.1 amidase [Actinomadura sp. NBRC 104425]
MQPFELSLTEASRAVRARELSPVELTESVLARIDAVEGRLGAYVTVAADAALAAAVRAEREISESGPRGPLHGIPMALKDLIDVAGMPTTASSHVRAGHVAERDSRVAERLGAAGAVLLGKTHTHEFAYGLTTPQTNNAWDQSRVAGGSSGGSAVAVATGGAVFAMGTDTGGSIRVPAALNGVVGLKPTYGLVPRTGVTSLSWSLDHVGPLARTVQDVALVLSAIADRDPASVSGPVPDRFAGGDLRGLKVGVPRNHYFDRVAPEVEESVRGAIERLAELGAEPVDVEIPMARYIQAVQWGLMVPEATAYHERSLRAVPDLYAADVRVLLEAGELTSAGDYLRAQRARTMMRDAWARMFDDIDVLAAPTVPMTAVEKGQEAVEWADGTTETVSDGYVRLCAPANITGVPALTLPVGRDRAGLPIGMQLMARPFHDATVLRVGRIYEESVGGAGRLAPLAA